jgi:hypothetical protein
MYGNDTMPSLKLINTKMYTDAYLSGSAERLASLYAAFWPNQN